MVLRGHRLQHPRRRIALMHVLYVEDTRVYKRVVGLDDQRVILIERLEVRVRVRKPDRICIEMKDVKLMRNHERLEEHLMREAIMGHQWSSVAIRGDNELLEEHLMREVIMGHQ